MAMERERFARNLAVMAAGAGKGVVGSGGGGGGMVVDGVGSGGGGGSRERWAAVRGFVRETMERGGEGRGGEGSEEGSCGQLGNRCFGG